MEFEAEPKSEPEHKNTKVFQMSQLVLHLKMLTLNLTEKMLLMVHLILVTIKSLHLRTGEKLFLIMANLGPSTIKGRRLHLKHHWT